MNLTLDFTAAQYSHTGVGRYTYNLAKHLLLLNNPPKLHLFGSSLRDFKNLQYLADSLTPNHTIFPLPPTFTEIFFNRLHWPPIDHFLPDTDIFHAGDWSQPRVASTKLVTTIHDLTVLKYPQHHHPKTISAHNRRLKWVKQEAAAIIADSQATKTDVQNLLGINPKKIHVVYLAASQNFSQFASLPSSQTESQKLKIRQRYNLDKPFILFVGTQEPRKNLARVLKAFAKLHPSQKNLELILVGKFGWGDQTSPTPAVRQLGFVPDEHLPALYSCASAFVYPSLYEGFGLPALEAMSVGTPVVTSNQGSLEEVAGQAAVMVDPYSIDSIAQGMEEALSVKKAFTTKAHLHSKQFTWHKTAQATLKVYESLV